MAEMARELVPDGFERPKQADMWRFGSPDEGFVVYLGSWEDHKTVRVHASIQIPDHKIDCFTASFLQAVMEYCEHRSVRQALNVVRAFLFGWLAAYHTVQTLATSYPACFAGGPQRRNGNVR